MPTVAPWPWNLHYYGKNDQVKDPESSFLPDSKPKKYHKKFSRLVIPITFLFNLPLWSVQKADRFWRIAMGYHKHSQALALQQLIYQIQYLFWSTSSPWTPDIKSPIWKMLYQYARNTWSHLLLFHKVKNPLSHSCLWAVTNNSPLSHNQEYWALACLHTL